MKTQNETTIEISLAEFKSLLGLYNTTKTLLEYQEMNKKDGIWEGMIDWSSDRVKDYMKELDTYNKF